MTKIYLLLATFCFLFSSCQQSEVEDLTEGESKEFINSSLKTSSEAEGNITRFKEALDSELSLFSTGITRGSSVEDIMENYDFSKQQQISSNKKGGFAYLIQSKINKNEFLGIYENSDGIILNIKKIVIDANETEAKVYSSQINNTPYLALSSEISSGAVTILSYNNQIFSPIQTRNGCSLAIGTAGLIWGTAFGVVSMGAGFAAGVVFLLLSEAMC